MAWIDKVAAATGNAPQTIRYALQEELLDFGKAFRRPGSVNYTYIAFPQRIKEEIGIDINEDEKEDS